MISEQTKETTMTQSKDTTLTESDIQIYDSTQYIEKPCVGDLKLEVNSQWDFSSRSVCFDYVGQTLISYDLKECTNVEGRTTSWKQASITEGIASALEKKGYEVSEYLKASLNTDIAG